jgi:hypothetical protein
MQLTERTDVWRMVGTYDGGKTMQAVLTRVPCLRVPISSFDKLASALSASTRSNSPAEFFRSQGRESTDVFLLPAWVTVKTDDELRRGRRVDINGNAVPYRYTVNGVRTYETFGYQDQLAVFCQSME